MNINALQLLQQFKHHFKSFLEQSTVNSRFGDLSDRKNYLDDTLLPFIANKMNLNYKKEFLRIDYTFFAKGSNKFDVPLVFIESENNWDDIEKEGLKLASTNAPLKVLISYGYPEERSLEMSQNDFLMKYIMEDFIEAGQLNGIHAIFLYDGTSGTPIFHVFAFDEKGNIIKEESEIISQTIA